MHSEASPIGEALKPLKAAAGSPDQRSGGDMEDTVYEGMGCHTRCKRRRH